MQAKLIALFAAHAAAVAVPSNIPSPFADDDPTPWPPAEAEARSIKQMMAARADPAAPVCNADNCLRNLRDKRYSASASDFCSIWIQSTITNTVYAVATDRQTVTQTPVPVTATAKATVDYTYVTGTETVTKYTTIADPRYAKRQENIYPAWLSTSYPASRVSSACSCFIATPSPAIKETVTLTTSTDAQTATQTLDPVTNTITQTATNTIPAVAKQTIIGGGLRCGIKGCVSSSAYLKGFTISEVPTLQACKAACMARPDCKSFDWGINGGGCALGSKAAADWWVNSYCAYRIRDRDCEV
ncbi:hypothetical protein QQS21_009643 [Conoideocrella luteorostrata]|uniref:Apple domain-containing protein n=1 Tax=Conoideocrella luteorostrata TaxID=1105319 RepID=A0AAJ0FQ57_9HYPO|nr:hypothetical protein QQS21_009643 [Conoideocrella luteorostrata]